MEYNITTIIQAVFALIAADRAAPPAACQISTSRSFRISSTCGLKSVNEGLSAQITQAQLALCDVYELVIGG